MYLIRALSIFAAIAALSFPVREHLRRSAVGRTAVVLVAEAAELCRGARTGGGEGLASATARRAAGVEALALAEELSDEMSNKRLSGGWEEIIASLRLACGENGGPADAAGSAGRYVSASDRDRRELVRPYLARLNGAALEAVEAGSRSAGEATAGETTDRDRSGSKPAGLALRGVEPVELEATVTETTGPETPASVPVESAMTGGEERALNQSVPKDPVTDASSTPRPSIEVSLGASRDYRRRVGRWVLVFGREAEALRVARLALQAEIDSSSVQRSVDACQTFGRVLQHVSPDLARAAPYRELALRADLMLARYRQGVNHCLEGRTAAAFAYLSEGDRAWTSLVRDSARLGRFRSVSGAS